MSRIAFGMIEWTVLGYFVLLNAAYLLLELVSLVRLTAYMRERALDQLPRRYSEHDAPVSLVVPAYNEETLVVTSVLALAQMDYQHFEVIVVNDGSTDGTLQLLIDSFEMEPLDEIGDQPIQTKPVRTVYQSRRYPNLRMVDKENGGKADANNAGFNAARHSLVCAVDADSVLQPDTIRRLARPFVEDDRTIAAGGTIRIANGSRISSGLFIEAGLPRRLLPLIQVVEYLRAFLFGRFGWDAMNAVLIVSGALGMFNRETVIEVGGYRTDTVGEDFELTVRLHRVMGERRRPYRVAFIPDPIAWTDAPEKLRALGRQRIRWQRGLAEGLMMNRSLLFKRGSGAAGWVNYPFQLVFECFGPLIEVIGYVYFTVAFLTGRVSATGLIAFAVLAIGVGLLLSATAVLLEEMSFRLYPKVRHVLILLLVVFVENFGYRQLVSIWRIAGLWGWLTKRRQRWDQVTRTTSWAGHELEPSEP